MNQLFHTVECVVGAEGLPLVKSRTLWTRNQMGLKQPGLARRLEMSQDVLASPSAGMLRVCPQQEQGGKKLSVCWCWVCSGDTGVACDGRTWPGELTWPFQSHPLPRLLHWGRLHFGIASSPGRTGPDLKPSTCSLKGENKQHFKACFR